MLSDNTCPLLYVIILLTHSVLRCYRNQSIDLRSSSTASLGIVTLLKIVKLNSAKNAMTDMPFVCYEPC